MIKTETTSLNLSVIADILSGKTIPWIKSLADYEWLKHTRIKGRKRLLLLPFHYICIECNMECQKQLRCITAFPIICQKCYMKRHKDEIQLKRESTCLIKYGATTALGVPELREKGYQHNVEKYGTRYPQTTDACKEKTKQTCIAKYGVCAPSQSEKIYAKQVEIVRQRYGVDNVNKLPECRNKINNTKKMRYGDEHYNNIEKAKATKLKKYGDANYNNSLKMRFTAEARYGGIGLASKELAQKVRNKLIQLYGVEHPMHSHELLIKTKRKYKYNNILFDSKPELVLYQALLESGSEFIYQPDISFTYEYNGKQHKYYPDFLIGSELVEIKGSHFFDEQGHMINPFDRTQDGLYEAKHQCMIANKVTIVVV